MAQLTFLGACREIGRSAFLLTDHTEDLLVDYGIRFEDNPLFPPPVQTDDLQGIVVTHSHLDHCGAVPRLLSEDDELSLFCTPATRDLTQLLIQDMFKVTRGHLPFDIGDVSRVKQQCQPVTYDECMPLGQKFEFTLFNAGHIPGSAMVSVKVDGRRVLFTGDFNSVATQLNRAARKDLPRHDVVVTESTYAQRVNPERQKIETEFTKTIVETLERGGCALIPAFAVGRTQEVMCILAKYGLMDRYPVFVDGLARDVNEVLLRHPQSIASSQLFERAVQCTRVIHDNQDRLEAVRKKSIVITPAGMLKGGPSQLYVDLLRHDERHTLVIVSFQVPGTPGAELLASHKFKSGGRIYNVAADVRYHHLSSHSDSIGLLDVLLSIPGSPEYFIVHGEPTSCDVLKSKLEESGRRAHIPTVGETVEL